MVKGKLVYFKAINLLYCAYFAYSVYLDFLRNQGNQAFEAKAFSYNIALSLYIVGFYLDHVPILAACSLIAGFDAFIGTSPWGLLDITDSFTDKILTVISSLFLGYYTYLVAKQQKHNEIKE